MTSDNIVRILHVSDLHFSKGKEFDQSVILKALHADLANLAEREFKPNLIIFSGDLVQSADDQDVYWRMHDAVIENLKRTTGCEDGAIFLYPGNHDASRDAVSRWRSDHLQLENIKERGQQNELYLDRTRWAFLDEKFQNFSEMQAFYGNQSPSMADAFCRVDHISSSNIDLIFLNTAATSSAGLHGHRNDRGSLIVPEAAVRRALDSCKPGSFKVLISHHPLDWLSDQSRTDVEATALSSVNLHLYGHMHDPKPVRLSSASSTYVQHQAGALHDGRDRYNGYAMISVEPNERHIEVIARSYFDKRRVFDTGNDVLPNGVFYPDGPSKTFWSANSIRINHEEIKKWVSEKLLPAAEMEFNEGLSDKPLSEVFVSPPMRLISASLTSKSDDLLPSQEENPITLEEIVNSHSNFVIYGQQEFGKTTLLQQASLEIMRRNKGGSAKSQVPILIQFPSIRKRPDPIQSILRGELPQPPSTINLSDLLKFGAIALLVDDVDFSDKTRWKLLEQFVQDHPQVRFIFTVSQRNAGEAGSLNASNSVARTSDTRFFEHVVLKPFTRGKLRTLVQQWGIPEQTDEERLLNGLVGAMRGMSIPLTAVNGTILLSIYEHRADFKIVNRAVLIEMFVEHALGKRDATNALRVSFDFKNKVFLLGALAANMARQNEYFVKRTSAVEIFREALNKIGLSENAETLMQHFCAARILRVDTDDYVSFRYRAFLEFFVASEMRANKAFKVWVLDEARYLSFINEIQYYAGIDRNDSDLLEAIAGRHDDLISSIKQSTAWSPDLSMLEKLNLPNKAGETDLLDDLHRQLDIPPMTPEERDQALDAELPRDEYDRQEVFRPAPKDDVSKWVLSLLLYSGLLKNLEMIPDVDKRKHLSKLLNSWGEYTVFSLAAVPLIAKHRRVSINGAQFQVLAPSDWSEAKLAKMISTQRPNSIGRVRLAALGTEKLQRQLLEPTLEEADAPLICELHRGILIAGLRLPSWVNVVKLTQSKLLSKSSYLSEAFLQTISEIHVLGAYTPDVGIKLREILADSISRLGGGTRSDQQRRHSDAMKQIRRRENIQRLKMRSSLDV